MIGRKLRIGVNALCSTPDNFNSLVERQRMDNPFPAKNLRRVEDANFEKYDCELY